MKLVPPRLTSPAPAMAPKDIPTPRANDESALTVSVVRSSMNSLD